MGYRSFQKLLAVYSWPIFIGPQALHFTEDFKEIETLVMVSKSSLLPFCYFRKALQTIRLGAASFWDAGTGWQPFLVSFLHCSQRWITLKFQRRRLASLALCSAL